MSVLKGVKGGGGIVECEVEGKRAGGEYDKQGCRRICGGSRGENDGGSRRW